MTTPHTVTLVEGRPWDPSSLLAEAFSWPGTWRVVSLSEIATRLPPTMVVSDGAEVVTPGDIDSVYGFIRRRSTTYQGAAYAVGKDPGDLKPGDVLVPRSGRVPAVLITPALEGSYFSDGFTAYRPETARVSGPVLWAVLSSASGQTLRELVSAGQAGAAPLLGESTVPVPAPAEQERLEPDLLRVARRISDTESEAVATWWSMANLKDTPWQFALATPDPGRLQEGEPLESLAQVVLGRRIDNERVSRFPSADSIPIATGATLVGKPPQRWLADNGDVTIASPGDVLVAAFGPRANAQVISEPMVVSNFVLRVRANDPRHASRIASFLNSQSGYARRGLYVASRPMGHFSASMLREMKIPEEALDEATNVGPELPLAAEMEDLLWTN